MKRKENNIKLYQKLSAKQLDSFLKTLGTSLEKQPLVEIMNKNEDLFGDFIVYGGYIFKNVYASYQCLQTPTEKHTKTQRIMPKAKNDYYKK